MNDQLWAAAIGAVSAVAVATATVALEAWRGRTQTAREERAHTERTLALLRIVGGELSFNFIRVKNAPAPTAASDHMPPLATQAWDRYAADVCAALPFPVVDKLLVAYSALRIQSENLGGAAQKTIDFDLVATGPGGPELIEQYFAAQFGRRESLQVAIREGFNALHPYLKDLSPASNYV